jgi:hypothetical protein
MVVFPLNTTKTAAAANDKDNNSSSNNTLSIVTIAVSMVSKQY